jgi:hypothetical protein
VSAHTDISDPAALRRHLTGALLSGHTHQLDGVNIDTTPDWYLAAAHQRAHVHEQHGGDLVPADPELNAAIDRACAAAHAAEEHWAMLLRERALRRIEHLFPAARTVTLTGDIDKYRDLRVTVQVVADGGVLYDAEQGDEAAGMSLIEDDLSTAADLDGDEDPYILDTVTLRLDEPRRRLRSLA